MLNLLKQSWGLFWANRRVALLTTLIYLLITIALSLITRENQNWLIYLLSSIVEIIVSGVMALGLMGLYLKIVNHEPVKVRDLFAVESKRLLSFIGLIISFYIAIGIPFFIVDWLVLAILLTFVASLSWFGPSAALGFGAILFWLLIATLISFIVLSYFIARLLLSFIIFVDKGTGVFQSLGMAWKISKGDVWLIVKTMWLILFFTILGSLALYLGLLIVMPISFILIILVYKKVSGKELPMVAQ